MGVFAAREPSEKKQHEKMKIALGMLMVTAKGAARNNNNNVAFQDLDTMELGESIFDRFVREVNEDGSGEGVDEAVDAIFNEDNTVSTDAPSVLLTSGAAVTTPETITQTAINKDLKLMAGEEGEEEVTDVLEENITSTEEINDNVTKPAIAQNTTTTVVVPTTAANATTTIAPSANVTTTAAPESSAFSTNVCLALLASLIV